MENTTVRKKPFFISYILIGINIILFLIMIFYQNSFSTDLTTTTLTKFGAKVNYLIADGQYYRLITAMFLHANLMHIVFNSLALRALGPDVEIFFGRSKFLIVYFVSGLIGSLGSYMVNDAVGVGASGAIFGLLGANLYLLTLNKELYKKIYGYDMIVLLGLNLVYGFMNSSIDNTAHLAGAVGGYLVAWSVGLKQQNPFKMKHMIFQAITILLIVTLMVWGIPSYKDGWRYNFYKGRSLYYSNDIDGAKSQFREGLEKDSENEHFIYYLEQLDKLD